MAGGQRRWLLEVGEAVVAEDISGGVPIAPVPRVVAQCGSRRLSRSSNVCL